MKRKFSNVQYACHIANENHHLKHLRAFLVGNDFLYGNLTTSSGFDELRAGDHISIFGPIQFNSQSG